MAASTTTFRDDRARIAWLHRRAGFGLRGDELDQAAARGVDAVLGELVDPDGHGVPAASDPWDGLELGTYDPGQVGRYGQQLIGRWLLAMATTPRPLAEWMRWFWHGHFVSTLREVKFPQLMVGQLRMVHDQGLGDFRTLLRSVTVDPAMLLYLDGNESRRGAVNENYGRELLELFALGVGHYTEADVRAGAEALTGWTVQRGTGVARFVTGRHDDTAHTYLGRTGVHDVDSVIDAVVAHAACAPFIAGRLARALLGPDVDAGLVDRLGRDFAGSGLQIRPLVRALLEAGLDGASTPLVTAPVPWLVSAIRSTGAPAEATLGRAARQLQPAGQVPLDAPNVGGWPGGRAWLASSTTVARINMAARVAENVPDGPVRRAATQADPAALATAIGRPEGFAAPTASAIRSLAGSGRPAPAVLTVALAAPDVVVT